MCTGKHPFIPVATGIQVKVRMLQDGQQIENVYWVDAGHTPTQTDVQDTAAEFSTWYTGTLLSLQAASVVGQSIVATGWDNEFGQQATDDTINGSVGARTSPALPNAVSIAVHWTTTIRGRSHQGHVMHAGLTEDAVTGNEVTSGFAAALTAAYNVLVDALVTAAYPLQVASFCNNKVWRTDGVLTPVHAAVLRDTVVDQAIRRKPGRGR